MGTRKNILIRAIQLGIGLTLAIASVGAGQTAMPDGQRQTALALEQQGSNAEAEGAWRIYLKMHPANAEAYAHLGLLEARQEHYKDAVPLYRRALALSPNVPGLRLNLGLALFKAGELKEALPEFELLRKSAAPGSAEAQRLTILIGMAHYGLAEYAAAAPYLKEASANEAASLPLLLALAHCYLWSNQYPAVLDVYRQILTVNPDSAEADMLAGEALDQMKDNAGATQMFREAIKANPKEPNVHFGLGYLLWTQKQYAGAAAEFQAELANDPTHAQAMLYLGDAYIQMNRFSEAEPLLVAALKGDPSLALAHLDMGIVASEAGQNGEALRELVLAEKLMPGDVNVHWRLGRLYRAMGKKDEAKAEFDKASNLNKQADDALYKKIANGAAHRPHGDGAAATAGGGRQE